MPKNSVVTLRQKIKHNTYQLKLTTMAANNNNNQAANNNVLTNKVLSALKKKANEYRDSFKNACQIFMELAATDNDARKVCAYLGINADALKNKNVSDTRKNVLDRLPLYYMIDGSESHFPAKLTKINKNAGIDGYIAVKDTYINALLSLAKILSGGNEYVQRKVTLTTASVDEAADAYTEDSVEFFAYDKEGQRLNTDTKKYIDYLNVNRLANNAAKLAKSAYITQAIGDEK